MTAARRASSGSKLAAVTGAVFALDQTATHDGPGLRLAVYLKGCPLRCVWCHSPESIDPRPEVVWYETKCVGCGRCIEACPHSIREAPDRPLRDRARCRRCGACVEVCPQGALAWKGEETTAGDILAEATRLLPFFRRSGGGITITGGEPLFQPEFTFALSALCRKAGIHVAVETAGHAKWEIVERQATVTDLWLHDLKHTDPEPHKEYTGVSNRRLLANLGRLARDGAEIIVRVPLIPGHNDAPEQIDALAVEAGRRGARRISLLPFNPAAPGKYSWLRRPYPLPDARKQSPETIAALEDVARRRGMTVVPP